MNTKLVGDLVPLSLELQTCQFDYYNICWQVKNIWAPYLSFKLSVRDKTWNWWIFPNRNLEHKYFEKLQKFCYLAKLWVLRSFTCWWKMIPGLSNLPEFWKFFSHYLFIHKKNFLYSNSSLTNACFSWLYDVFLTF